MTDSSTPFTLVGLCHRDPEPTDRDAIPVQDGYLWASQLAECTSPDDVAALALLACYRAPSGQIDPQPDADVATAVYGWSPNRWKRTRKRLIGNGLLNIDGSRLTLPAPPKVKGKRREQHAYITLATLLAVARTYGPKSSAIHTAAWVVIRLRTDRVSGHTKPLDRATIAELGHLSSRQTERVTARLQTDGLVHADQSSHMQIKPDGSTHRVAGSNIYRAPIITTVWAAEALGVDAGTTRDTEAVARLGRAHALPTGALSPPQLARSARGNWRAQHAGTGAPIQDVSGRSQDVSQDVSLSTVNVKPPASTATSDRAASHDAFGTVTGDLLTLPVAADQHRASEDQQQRQQRLLADVRSLLTEAWGDDPRTAAWVEHPETTASILAAGLGQRSVYTIADEQRPPHADDIEWARTAAAVAEAIDIADTERTIRALHTMAESGTAHAIVTACQHDADNSDAVDALLRHAEAAA